MNQKKQGIWFPTVKCGTGTDIFTITLVEELNKRGIRAEITWLPHHAEYLPWFVPKPKTPEWATVAHINTWLHPRFIPSNIPVIATLHHSIHDPELQPFKGFLRTQYHSYWIKNIEKETMSRASIVVAVSQFSANTAQQQVTTVPIRVIRNGVDTNRFKPKKNKTMNHPFRLLYVGSWMKRKGVDLLAPIMNELGDDYTLYYTGGDLAKKNKKDMPKNMIDIGRLDSHGVIKAMQDADALLFPSRSEGLPLTGIEAMSCGLPIIGTNASSFPEIIENKKTGFLCELNKIADFAYACKALAENTDLYLNMCLESRKKIQSGFTMGRMVSNYIDLYNQLNY